MRQYLTCTLNGSNIPESQASQFSRCLSFRKPSTISSNPPGHFQDGGHHTCKDFCKCNWFTVRCINFCVQKWLIGARNPIWSSLGCWVGLPSWLVSGYLYIICREIWYHFTSNGWSVKTFVVSEALKNFRQSSGSFSRWWPPYMQGFLQVRLIYSYMYSKYTIIWWLLCIFQLYGTFQSIVAG